ncbi:ankyrin repeat-containing protein [Tanacetum coccineum]
MGFNTNCTSGGAMSSSVVYEEVVAAEDKRVISSVPELRQRTRFREDSMFRIDENVKDMDDDLTSTSRLSNTERPEMNGHCVGRMLEKDKSLDWRQLLPDDDPNYNLDGSIDEPVEDGDTALHLTCLYGHLSCVQLLLEMGASVEAKDEDGGVPLHDACAGGFMEIVQLLVGKADSPECLKRMLESVDVEGDTCVYGNPAMSASLRVPESMEHDSPDASATGHPIAEPESVQSVPEENHAPPAMLQLDVFLDFLHCTRSPAKREYFTGVYESWQMLINVSVNEKKADGFIQFICFLVGDFVNELVLPLEVWPCSCSYDQNYVELVDAQSVVHVVLDPKIIHFDQISRNRFVVNFYTKDGDEVDYGRTKDPCDKCLVLGCHDPRMYQPIPHKMLLNTERFRGCKRVPIEFNGVVTDIGITFSRFSKLRKLVGVAFTDLEWERVCSASKVIVISSDE